MESYIRITPSLSLRRSELRFRTSRSGGPGGQHVNTSDTQVELLFDVAKSDSLGPRQRARLLEKLSSRLDGRGVLHLSSSAHRSQTQNRHEVVRRLQELLTEALRRPRPRKATRPTAASRRRRKEAKRRRSQRKRERRAVDPEKE
ncbi:MAG TPA: alternative ribosome rescue aminoacyl-tRNA hydrolase ArfB [Candidatus Krumholzibacteria bacterium]|nr:alternative ribosome rescue aminoacyl-tRNA hydrolase ArfB [Candidatus Krumholzibacteria bacterium]